MLSGDALKRRRRHVVPVHPARRFDERVLVELLAAELRRGRDRRRSEDGPARARQEREPGRRAERRAVAGDEPPSLVRPTGPWALVRRCRAEASLGTVVEPDGGAFESELGARRLEAALRAVEAGERHGIGERIVARRARDREEHRARRGRRVRRLDRCAGRAPLGAGGAATESEHERTDEPAPHAGRW